MATDNQDRPVFQPAVTWAKESRPSLNAESKCLPECPALEKGHIPPAIPSSIHEVNYELCLGKDVRVTQCTSYRSVLRGERPSCSTVNTLREKGTRRLMADLTKALLFLPVI